MMFSTPAFSRRAGALPNWLIVVTYVVGVAEFVNVTLGTPTLYVFPAWITLVSIVVLVTAPRLVDGRLGGP